MSHVRHIPGNPKRGEPRVTIDGEPVGELEPAPAPAKPAPKPRAAKKPASSKKAPAKKPAAKKP